MLFSLAPLRQFTDHFTNRDLMPADKQVIDSVRHSFEQRMLEAELDFELWCRPMGHAAGRQRYGNGGPTA